MNETYELDVIKGELIKEIPNIKSIKDIDKLISKYINPNQQKTLETQIREEIERCKSRSFSTIIEDHKRLISSGGLITGFASLDDHLIFQKSDLNIIQGMSNHGKSSFMLNLNYRFLTNKENESQDPICIYLAYESHIIRTEEKFLNIITSDKEKQILIKMDRKTEVGLLDNKNRYGNYLYLKEDSVIESKKLYEKLIEDERLFIMKKQPIENLPELLDYFKQKYKKRTIVLFLDYIQILPQLPSSKTDGWEKMKEIAYWLENLAIEKEIIIFTGSQVNESRDTREGKDIYNAATINIDIFNNSHELLIDHKDLGKNYKPKIDGKNIVTLTCRKAKFGETFTIPEGFLFNGILFEENNTKAGNQYAETIKRETPKQKNRYGYGDDEN